MRFKRSHSAEAQGLVRPEAPKPLSILSRASIEEQDAKRGEGSRWVLFCLILAVAYLLWRW